MNEGGCCCSGIRFCGRCIGTERAQAIINQHVPLTSMTDVIPRQHSAERTSSCSFACVGASAYSLCTQCGLVFVARDGAFKACAEHAGLSCNPNITLGGLLVVPDFISSSEEEDLLTFFDSPAPFPSWKPSQSGRRKQDYGPKANFKKRKIKVFDMPGMPLQLKEILERISSFVTQRTMKEYCIVEVSVLEYTSETNSSIDPHIDDTWLWGNRVSGLNLLHDTVMTFVHIDGAVVDVFLPRGAFYLLSNESRYAWMHGIRGEHIKGRRVSITVRELTDKLDFAPDLIDRIRAKASTFV